MLSALMSGFPRLYAAASLKPRLRRGLRGEFSAFSAALCRGLIEARGQGALDPEARRRFPRLYAAASLKRDELLETIMTKLSVFRGFMPRPH